MASVAPWTPQDPPRSERRRLNGFDHHVLAWDGPSDGPAVVVLHGYLDCAWSFAPFVEELRKRLPGRVYAIDLRGHGESARAAPGGYYHFPDYVSDAYHLLRSVGGPVHLVGHSMGGNVAALVAAAFPELIAKLVLAEGLGPPPLGDEEPPDRMGRWIREVEERNGKSVRPLRDVAAAALRLREQNPRLGEALSLFLAEKSVASVEGGVSWRFDPLHRTRSPMPFVVSQFRSFLKRIASPTLLVEGAESGFRSFIDDDRERDVADYRSVVLADAGHMMHHDVPGPFAEAVAAFLQSKGQ